MPNPLADAILSRRIDPSLLALLGDGWYSSPGLDNDADHTLEFLPSSFPKTRIGIRNGRIAHLEIEDPATGLHEIVRTGDPIDISAFRHVRTTLPLVLRGNANTLWIGQPTEVDDPSEHGTEDRDETIPSHAEAAEERSGPAVAVEPAAHAIADIRTHAVEIMAALCEGMTFHQPFAEPARWMPMIEAFQSILSGEPGFDATIALFRRISTAWTKHDAATTPTDDGADTRL